MDFLNGYMVGLGMIIFIGPVFFFLLSSSLKGGFIPGLLVALGIIVSDIIYVILCSYGLTQLITHPTSLYWIALIGGILLIGMGVKYISTREFIIETPNSLNTKHYFEFFTKGFLVNFINPFVLLVWIGLIEYTKQTPTITSSWYLTGVLLGIFSTDFAKVLLAKHIKKLITPYVLKRIYKISGVILIIFGLRMCFYFYFK